MKTVPFFSDEDRSSVKGLSDVCSTLGTTMIGYKMNTYLSFCHRRQVSDEVGRKFRGADARTEQFHVWCKDL